MALCETQMDEFVHSTLSISVSAPLIATRCWDGDPILSQRTCTDKSTVRPNKIQIASVSKVVKASMLRTGRKPA
jgi:hypothetical protein